MLALLARFIFLMTLYFLVARAIRRLFSGRSPASGGGFRAARERQPAEMVRDPVCGMYLDPSLALRAEHRREQHYFCSEECRKNFLAAPPA